MRVFTFPHLESRVPSPSVDNKSKQNGGKQKEERSLSQLVEIEFPMTDGATMEFCHRYNYTA